jgi:DNA polymerase eta
VQYNNRRGALPGEASYKGGAIIALSYEAKAMGVRRHMRGDEARKVCPDIVLVTVPVRNEKADLVHYREAGTDVFSRFSESGVRCERTSIDEAYLDVTEMAMALLRSGLDELRRRVMNDDDARCTRVVSDDGRGDAPLSPAESESSATPTSAPRPSKLLGKADRECIGLAAYFQETLAPLLSTCGAIDAGAEEGDDGDGGEENSAVGGGEVAAALLLVAGAVVLGRLRAEVTRATGYTLSAGVAHNKLLAKLVSGRNKPDKQTIIPTSAVGRLLAALPLRDLNGFGGKLGDALLGPPHRFAFVGELRALSRKELHAVLRASHTALGDKSPQTLENAVNFMWSASRGECDKPVEARLLSKSMGCGKTFQGKSALRTLAQVQHYLNCLAAELETRVRATFSDHRRAPRLLVATYHCGYKTVKRKGVEFNLTASSAPARPMAVVSGMQGSRAGMAAGGSKSCAFPGAADGSFTALAIARLAYDLIATAIKTHAQVNAEWKCTALYITAQSFFDLPSPAERIDRFFAVAGAPPTAQEPAPAAARDGCTNAPAVVAARGGESVASTSARVSAAEVARSSHAAKRTSVIDETMLSALPPDIRAEVERRRHEYERHCTFGSAMQPRAKKRRAATALDTFLVESTSAPPARRPARPCILPDADTAARAAGTRSTKTRGAAGACRTAPGAARALQAAPNVPRRADIRAPAPGVPAVAWEDVDESFLRALPLHIRAELKSRARRTSAGGGSRGAGAVLGALEGKSKAKSKERGGKSIASFFK